MRSELHLEDVPPTDSIIPVVELRVRTVSGDLQIVRAAASTTGFSLAVGG